MRQLVVMAGWWGVALVVAFLSASFEVDRAGAASEPQFSAPVIDRVSGTFVSELVAVDLNRDGKPDLATVDHDSGAISVLLGDGNGSFRRRATYHSGAVVKPSDLDTADVDGDGAADLIVANHGRTGSIAVVLNDGKGRFLGGKAYASGPKVVDVDAADVNGDGVLDLLAASKTHQDLSVLLGTGGGGFGAARVFVAGAGARDLALGDVNGDGKLDVALAQWVGNAERAVAIRVGNGDGTFGPATAFGRESDSVTVTLADFDEDGQLDLALSVILMGNVAVQLGNGDATFRPRARYPMGYLPAAVAVADFNQDQHADIATAVVGDGFAVRSGRGDERPSVGSQTWPGPLAYDTPAVADLDRDGRLDVAFPTVARADGGRRYSSTGRGGPQRPASSFPSAQASRAARRDIERAGCRVGDVGHRHSGKVERGVACSQRPPYGSVLPSHSRVHIVLKSRQPSITAPPMSTSQCAA